MEVQIDRDADEADGKHVNSTQGSGASDTNGMSVRQVRREKSKPGDIVTAVSVSSILPPKVQNDDGVRARLENFFHSHRYDLIIGGIVAVNMIAMLLESQFAGYEAAEELGIRKRGNFNVASAKRSIGASSGMCRKNCSCRDACSLALNASYSAPRRFQRPPVNGSKTSHGTKVTTSPVWSMSGPGS
jgi:hypothetical protein